MAGSVPFRLNRCGLLLALVSAALAGQAAASTAGRVDFAFGGATLTGADGQQRPLARGTEVNGGDVVRTGNGRVQMRMKDGAYISLQPNTEFGIKSYNFEGKTDGTESAFYSLLKGAMRTVTGLIGRVNRNRYQVATPTATVGIRGTGGLIQILNDGGTLVQGTSGIWFLQNPAGSIDIPAGVSGLAPANPTQPPKETAEIPTAGPAPLPPQQDFSQGDERNSDGESVITAPVAGLASGAVTGTLAYTWFSSPYLTIAVGGSATFDAAGRMTNIADEIGQKFSADPDVTKIVDYGNDGIIAWGRWTGNVTGLADIDGLLTVDETYSASQGLHYVVGAPTASMPQIGAATYALIGATRPTYVDGIGTPGTLTGSLTVDFGQLTVGTNLNVSMAGAGYSISGTSQIAGPYFIGYTGGGLAVTGSGSACLSSCSAYVQGFFAGTTAERAGLGYQVNDFQAGKDIIGAAAFAKQ